MKEDCFEVEQIPSVLELPAGDQRRCHLESCPRCRNLARSYAAFLKAETGAGARLAEAREHLAQVILETTGETGFQGTGRKDSPPYAAGSRRDTERNRWWPLWRARPAGLLAAAAVVTLLAVILWQDRPTAPPVLRNDRTPRAGALSLLPAEVSTRGGVRLTWTHSRDADRYEVRIYDAQLAEVYRRPAVEDTSVVVNLSEIPATPGSPGLVWRVFAFQGNDVVSVSLPGSIPLPQR